MVGRWSNPFGILPIFRGKIADSFREGNIQFNPFGTKSEGNNLHKTFTIFPGSIKVVDFPWLVSLLLFWTSNIKPQFFSPHFWLPKRCFSNPPMSLYWSVGRSSTLTGSCAVLLGNTSGGLLGMTFIVYIQYIHMYSNHIYIHIAITYMMYIDVIIYTRKGVGRVCFWSESAGNFEMKLFIYIDMCFFVQNLEARLQHDFQSKSNFRKLTHEFTLPFLSLCWWLASFNLQTFP